MLKNKSIILVSLLSVTVLSCPQSETITKEATKLVNIEKKVVLSEGESKKISYETTSSGENPSFGIINSNIAEVDSVGNIKAKSKGSTKIIAFVNGQTYTIDLEVNSTKITLTPLSNNQTKEDEKICNICGENVKIKKNEFCPNHTCKNDETSNNQIQNQSNQNQIETNSCNICGTIVTIQGTCPSTTCKNDEITSPSIVQSLVPTSTPIQTAGETPSNTQTQEATTTPTITTSVTAIPSSPTIVPTTIQTPKITTSTVEDVIPNRIYSPTGYANNNSIFAPEKAIDKDFNSDWNAGRVAPAELIIDFAEKKSFNQINLVPHSNPAGELIYDILASNDNIEYNYIKKDIIGKKSEYKEIFFEKVNYRYLKINCKDWKTSWVSIIEVSIKYNQ